VVVGGLVASTLVTLVLIPVTYTAVTALATRLRARRWHTGSGAETEDQDRATA
jgi:uncharacterized protein (DUF2062 family)